MGAAVRPALRIEIKPWNAWDDEDAE